MSPKHHLGALAHEQPRLGRALSLRPTADQRHLAIEPPHDCLLGCETASRRSLGVRSVRCVPTPRRARWRRLRRHAVHAAIGPVVHVAGGDDPRLVGVRSLDEEDQLVTHVTMRGQRRARLEASQDRPALARLVLPDPLLAHARPRLDPRQIVEREDFRGRCAAALRGRLHAAGEDRQHVAPFLVEMVWTQPLGR